MMLRSRISQAPPLALALLTGSVLVTTTPAVLGGSPAATGIVAEADTAESVFAAPAGMSRLVGNHLTVQTVIVGSQSHFEVDESLTTVDGGNPKKGSDPIIIPSLYYVRQLNDNWHAGISLTVPSGFGADYGKTWAGRYETVDFSLVYIALTPALSYRVNDKLSLGGSVGFNYTAETSELKIPQPLDEGDGKLTSDLDGLGINVTLSMLYQFTERTRAGIAWTSDSDADLEGDVKLRELGPVFEQVATALGIKNINVELTNTLPQRAMAGVYHEFESGNYFTVDGMYMKFSDFTVTDVKVNDNNVDVTVPDIYNDIWAVTVGAGFPVDDLMTYKVGAMYVSQAVDDEDRSFSIRLDEMWGLGVGLNYKLGGGRSVDVNANYINVGKAPVDTGGIFGTDRGRVVGESNNPYVFMFELTYHL